MFFSPLISERPPLSLTSEFRSDEADHGVLQEYFLRLVLRLLPLSLYIAISYSIHCLANHFYGVSFETSQLYYYFLLEVSYL